MNAQGQNRRILLIDDNPAIHEDFKKILASGDEHDDYFGSKALMFGGSSISTPRLQFKIDSAYQGQQGLDMIVQAAGEGSPYAMAFVDVRMPPGWDGIETVAHIWEKYPDLQVVICTAYSDYSWDDMQQRFGQSDSLLILKKPFDNVEVLQLAQALTAKWNVTRAAKMQIERLDQAVARSEERFTKAFQKNPVAMFIETLDGMRVLDANPAFLKLIDRPPEEIFGHAVSELKLWGTNNVTTVDALACGKAGENTLTRVYTRLGEERDVIVFAEEFEVEREACRLVLLQDVTEHLRLEGNLRQAHKMEAIGQLAAGVAHDFNNILTIIQGHISLVLTRDHLGNETSRLLTQALAASDRAGTLTRQLLAFSRKQMIERKPLHPSSLFEQVEAMLKRLIGDQVEISIECPNDLPHVFADRCNVEQIILNLAVNARDAMPNGGKLIIGAFEVRADHAIGAPEDKHVGGTFICLRFTDTGFGMDDATKARIFEPFFTTKAVGRGTGMGLATVYGIVKQHQGWVEVDSIVGQGTTFRVYLPVSVEVGNPTIVPKPDSPAGEARGDETILVVEDEPMLLEFVEDVLGSRGYHVLKATNATEALNIWGRESRTVALLLTDMVMPGGVTGKQLADKLKRDKPELRVIFSSGYSLDLVAGESLPAGVSVLQKPYLADMLVRTVRECLDAQNDQTGQLSNGWLRQQVAV